MGLTIDGAGEDGVPGNADSNVVIKFTSNRDLKGDDTIRIELTGYPEGSADSRSAQFTGTNIEGEEQTISGVALGVDDKTEGDQPLIITRLLASGVSFKADTAITVVIADIKTGSTPDTAMATVTVTDDINNEEADASGQVNPDVTAKTNAVNIGVVLSTNTTSPGATARVIVEVATGNGQTLADGDLEEIVIDMGKFGLPSTIDEDDVSLRGLAADRGDETGRGAPESISIFESKVTITVDDMDQRVDAINAAAAAGFQGLSPHFRVIFSTGSRGNHPVESGRLLGQDCTGDKRGRRGRQVRRRRRWARRAMRSLSPSP